MSTEKAVAIVLRTTDWSETSRIATLWTREFGKVRALAKGGRRLNSKFESALDLLTVCNVVFIRKSSGGLDLLTEAQVAQRFAGLRSNLPALYAGYYIAELLSDWTEDYDPHPVLFEEVVAALTDLASLPNLLGPRLVRFELAFLRELGYSPTLRTCAGCGVDVGEVQAGVGFSPASGGVLCTSCSHEKRDTIAITPQAWRALIMLDESGDLTSATNWNAETREEIRRLLNQHMTYLRGRPARLLPYLGS